MTKKRKVSSPDQPTLFDFVQESIKLQNTSTPHGSLHIARELAAALSEDLRHACDASGHELSRAQVAARMSDLLGEEVTVSGHLNNWTATSHSHEIPACHLPAFILATGGQRRAMAVLSRYSGLFLLPGPEALRAEIELLEEEEKHIKEEKRKRRFYLKELEAT